MADTKASEVHLCVMVHGLWGHPHHLDQVAAALREAYPDELLQIIIPKTNAGNSTYDGIERGGERVTREIEEEVETIAKSGREVRKISMVGYSLGGLVARYAVGLLYSQGFFEKIKPIVSIDLFPRYTELTYCATEFYHIRNTTPRRTDASRRLAQ